MNQCVQANFDNNSDTIEGNSSAQIGAHLLHIPQVMDNYSSLQDESTERPYEAFME